ncbi:MAG: DegV family protein [Clostridiales bacterium]|nr:DegV family protein [Clostridiales bacterium]
MNKVILVDSCCNLPSSFYHENKDFLHMISMPIHLGNRDFLDEHGKTITYKEFYDELRNGVVPSTSQITPINFFDKFKEFYDAEKEMLYIAFSSGMSGTHNNAIIAKEMFLEEYPNAKITIVDSFSASAGYGVIVKKAVEMIHIHEISDIAKFIEDNRLNINHIFSVQDLMFLKNGGRIPPALAAVGTLLNLKPIMDVDTEGKLRQKEKVRGKKKVYHTFLTAIKANYIPEMSSIIIGHGNCEEDAIELKSMIEIELGYKDIIISEESPTIGSHVGPGLLVIGYMGNERR